MTRRLEGVEMARQEMGRLGDAVARDPELRAELERAKTVEEMIATAGAAGYVFTVEDLREESLVREHELTEAQLDTVAGGGNVFAIWLTVGHFSVRDGSRS